MSKEKDIRAILRVILTDAVSSYYVETLIDAIIDDVIADIKDTADVDWSLGDVQLAVGRVLTAKFTDAE